MKQPFDYNKALAELEAIAARVENPATPLEDVGALVHRSRELTAACRAYLRTVREEVEKAEED